MQTRIMQSSVWLLCWAIFGVPSSMFAGKLRESANRSIHENTSFVINLDSEAEKELTAKLRDTIIESVVFEDQSLDESVRWIAETQKIQIVYDDRSIAEENIDCGEKHANLKLHNVHLTTVLKLLLDPFDLEYITNDGVLIILPISVADTK